jgi:1,6-anhydro-N-acetylmuramate kinase
MKDMPSWPAICRWMRENEEFRKQYAQARELSAEALEAEALFAVRTARTTEDAAIARGILDAVKWSAAKRNPKVFGEKMDVRTVNLTKDEYEQLTDAELIAERTRVDTAISAARQGSTGQGGTGGPDSVVH